MAREAGTYRVALGSEAWVDVVRGSDFVPSVAHGHGPECTGIRKIVDFKLTPGSYTLQIAAQEKPAITLMIARLSSEQNKPAGIINSTQ